MVSSIKQVARRWLAGAVVWYFVLRRLRKIPGYERFMWKMTLYSTIIPFRLPWVGKPFRILAFMYDPSSTALFLNKWHNFEQPPVESIMGASLQPIVKAEDIKYMLKDNWKNYQKNDKSGGFHDMFLEVMGEGIFAVDGEKWATLRKVASYMFSKNALRHKMNSVFANHSKVLRKHFEDFAKDGNEVDLQNIFQAFTFDTICEIAFGHIPGALEDAVKGEKLEFLVAFDEVQQRCVERLSLPDFYWKGARYFEFGAEAKQKKNAEILRGYVEPIVEKRKAEISSSLDGSIQMDSSQDLLTLFILHARKSNQPELESSDYLRDVILNFMIAGRDTTSFTLTNIFRLLSENPEVAEKAVKELDELNIDADKNCNIDALDQASYLDAIFFEALRMFPPVGGDFRMCVEDDVMPSGLKVKGGTRCLINNYVISYSPVYENADSFIPERWLSPEVDSNGNTTGKIKAKLVSEYTHPIFWAGPRICLGKDAARFEVKIVMASLLSHIRVQTKATPNAYLPSPVMFHRFGMPATFATK